MVFWNDLVNALKDCDIVVSSTASSVAVITTEAVRAATVKRRRPIMFIDLAVPRDIETGVSDISDAYLYDIDDLEQVAANNRQLRQDEVGAAEQLIEENLQAFWQERFSNQRNLRQQAAEAFFDIADDESQRLINKLQLDEVQSQATQQAMQRLAKKMNHRLLYVLKRRSPSSGEIIDYQDR